ncbi:MAG: hypothetical protein UV82_C0006G0031 [Candidatus Magasanikbacteria bacterium GW2011_GWD2_43_18]|uniref:Uncharacterized protein n=1 Tax=Candidatus Magasanikbacteria bacterium GW2011_GWE2_42_7 TaxID=1619052 RepID=A0A0G1E6S4_9BACT|nr:MAG: hypothetical protein UV18_C0005G0056 [Candidatus Magasanikbacteria bacterium GW2011_GWC2_42_27]KKS70258.1 MAG: hypothetical protein UV42_C0064G0010 [Candidatus Magasanikbacteria bacterium GW2011_GWE2_42_7]KKT04675.1 MAG: hypothetical protein UV82_C0006G0031 [Candidatus Magasanikbacteria bacterium GW2011_GWD2_43_18]HBB37982.1 hypothetical protein [Candidatus Magasanikbacteria bacterium]HCC13266.1 hypothetical protein [Candidatus Magasanikbacteria bacterium]
MVLSIVQVSPVHVYGDHSRVEMARWCRFEIKREGERRISSASLVIRAVQPSVGRNAVVLWCDCYPDISRPLLKKPVGILVSGSDTEEWAKLRLAHIPQTSGEAGAVYELVKPQGFWGRLQLSALTSAHEFVEDAVVFKSWSGFVDWLVGSPTLLTFLEVGGATIH